MSVKESVSKTEYGNIFFTKHPLSTFLIILTSNTSVNRNKPWCYRCFTTCQTDSSSEWMKIGVFPGRSKVKNPGRFAAKQRHCGLSGMLNILTFLYQIHKITLPPYANYRNIIVYILYFIFVFVLTFCHFVSKSEFTLISLGVCTWQQYSTTRKTFWWRLKTKSPSWRFSAVPPPSSMTSSGLLRWNYVAHAFWCNSSVTEQWFRFFLQEVHFLSFYFSSCRTLGNKCAGCSRPCSLHTHLPLPSFRTGTTSCERFSCCR